MPVAATVNVAFCFSVTTNESGKSVVRCGAIGAGLTTSAKVLAGADPAELAADKVILNAPAWVGVPEITPLAELKRSPAGRGVTPKVMGGVPEVVKVYVKAI